MKKINRKFLIWSLGVCLFAPLFLPSSLSTDGMSRYSFGLPFKYMVIYQRNPNNGWFFDNFFNGNDGLSINPAVFAINVFVIYLLITLIFSKFLNKNHK